MIPKAMTSSSHSVTTGVREGSSGGRGGGSSESAGYECRTLLGGWISSSVKQVSLALQNGADEMR